MHITLIQCNGLESNEKFFEKKNCQKKHFLSKNFYEKNKFREKKFSGNFPKFLS